MELHVDILLFSHTRVEESKELKEHVQDNTGFYVLADHERARCNGNRLVVVLLDTRGPDDLLFCN